MTEMTALADNLNLILTQDPYPSYTIFVGEGVGSPLSMTVEVEDGAASTIKLNTGTDDTETIELNPGIAFTAENLAEIMAPTFGVCQPANIRVLRVSHEAEINPYSVLPPLFRR